jgi:hypothetical protein
MKVLQATSSEQESKSTVRSGLGCWNLLMKSASAMSYSFGTSASSDKCQFPIRYKGVNLDCGYRLDIVVENFCNH